MLAGFLDHERIVALARTAELRARIAEIGDVGRPPRPTQIAAAALPAPPRGDRQHHDQRDDHRGRHPPIRGHPIDPRSRLHRRGGRLLRARAAACAGTGVGGRGVFRRRQAAASAWRPTRAAACCVLGAGAGVLGAAALGRCGAGVGAVAGTPSLRCSALSSLLRMSIKRCDSASCPSKSLTRSLQRLRFRVGSVRIAAAAPALPPEPGRHETQMTAGSALRRARATRSSGDALRSIASA